MNRTMAILVSCALWLLTDSASGSILTVGIGPPRTGGVSRLVFDITIQVESPPDSDGTLQALRLVFANSHPLLSDRGTDFSRFEFEIQLAEWSVRRMPLVGPTFEAVPEVPFAALQEGVYDAGDLFLDISGLPPGDYFVSIAGADSGQRQTDGTYQLDENLFIQSLREAGELSLDPSTQSFTIRSNVVPEPGSITVFAGLIVVVAVGSLRRRRRA